MLALGHSADAQSKNFVRNNPNHDIHKVLLEVNSEFGTEFTIFGPNEFQKFLCSLRKVHNVSLADCQWQNSVAEGSVEHLSLSIAGVRARCYLWAMNHVNNVANLLPT